jgi:hydroxymethylpyrimidine pyrophosphatase-like HAD family hydrolase
MTSPETNSSHAPEFNAGTFTISHFSDNPEGFEFATKEAIGRTGSFENGEELVLEEDQRSRLGGAIDLETQRPTGGAMRREMGFNGVTPVVEARQAWRESMQGDDEAETARLHDEFLRVRGEYIGRGKKIGFRAIELANGNTLQADVQLVPYPVYNTLSSPEATPEVEKLSAASGVAMVVETSDHRLVIQHRGVKKQKITEPGMTRGNASYADIPGASVAGMIDASLSVDSDRLPGTPDPVDTDFLKSNILKETSEELGIAPDDVEGLRIVGLAQDHYKPHDEVLFLSTLKLTSAELREASRTSNRNKNLADADFEEKFFDIEGSPRAIETLLTDVKCPLPPTHAAAMVAAGYSMVVRESGPEAAHIWRERMQEEVRRNYEEIDRTVAAYYDTYTEMRDHVPERYWGQDEPPARNRDGYSPAYTPEEQGLPTLEDEMIRTGLMPETRTRTKKGRTYDVDGVLTDPQEKIVIHEEILDEIIAQLERDEPVCFNTGRSDAWVMDRVVTTMLEKIQDKDILRNLIIVGEKGGTWTTFNQEGEPAHSAVETISVPAELKDRVRALIGEKYSDVMFFDESKETMISVEMVDGYNLTAFAGRQKEFAADVQVLLEETKTDSLYRVDSTTIATDIESPNVGKALGSDRFIEFLRIRGIKVESFEAYGDSGSDAAMADELARRGQHVDFFYVGNDPESVKPRADYQVHETAGFSAGTLASLRQ